MKTSKNIKPGEIKNFYKDALENEFKIILRENVYSLHPDYKFETGLVLYNKIQEVGIKNIENTFTEKCFEFWIKTYGDDKNKYSKEDKYSYLYRTLEKIAFNKNLLLTTKHNQTYLTEPLYVATSNKYDTNKVSTKWMCVFDDDDFRVLHGLEKWEFTSMDSFYYNLSDFQGKDRLNLTKLIKEHKAKTFANWLTLQIAIFKDQPGYTLNQKLKDFCDLIGKPVNRVELNYLVEFLKCQNKNYKDVRTFKEAIPNLIKALMIHDENNIKVEPIDFVL